MLDFLTEGNAFERCSLLTFKRRFCLAFLFLQYLINLIVESDMYSIQRKVKRVDKIRSIKEILQGCPEIHQFFKKEFGTVFGNSKLVFKPHNLLKSKPPPRSVMVAQVEIGVDGIIVVEIETVICPEFN